MQGSVRAPLLHPASSPGHSIKPASDSKTVKRWHTHTKEVKTVWKRTSNSDMQEEHASHFKTSVRPEWPIRVKGLPKATATIPGHNATFLARPWPNLVSGRVRKVSGWLIFCLQAVTSKKNDVSRFTTYRCMKPNYWKIHQRSKLISPNTTITISGLITPFFFLARPGQIRLWAELKKIGVTCILLPRTCKTNDVPHLETYRFVSQEWYIRVKGS